MQCLKVLTMSGWNPPPGNRKMHGDLMYLYIVTVEERHVSVTASTRGFYLNQSVNILTSEPYEASCFYWDGLFADKLHCYVNTMQSLVMTIFDHTFFQYVTVLST